MYNYYSLSKWYAAFLYCSVIIRGGGTGGAIARVEEHCSPYILRVRLNTEQPKSSIDIAVVL